MTIFSIQHGATALCTWNLNTGIPTLHARAVQQNGILVLEETDKLGFVLAPAPEGMKHRIFIGDVPLSGLVPVPEDEEGVAIGGQLFWRDLMYFESARGQTRVVLESQPEESTTNEWKTIFTSEVHILPSKLGEVRYQQMTKDLQDLSRSLLIDLYGKSKQTYDVRFSKEAKTYHAPEQELASVETVLERLAELLNAIKQRPASCVRAIRCQQRYWGGERLSPVAITAMCRCGTALMAAERPILIASQRKVESFDIAEHRVTRAFLDILVRRAKYCARVARRNIDVINSDRHMRHIRIGSGPTLFESIDLPRIKRLNEGIRNADHVISMASALASLPFLRDAKSELVAVQGGAFQRSPEYQTLLSVIRRYLISNAVWYEGDEMSTITKLTSRLFEQWCYLRIVEAFRGCGLELQEWTNALRDNTRSHFILDFDRGMTFEGMISGDLRLRCRYEPWILGEASAIKAKETLCRGSATDVAWSPDIVIECLKLVSGTLIPIYGIVLDSKYTAEIKSQHWSETSKYLEIRCSASKRQVVRQLWLISPSDKPGIMSEDPAVCFSDIGPSCASNESVRFHLAVTPLSVGRGQAGGSLDTDPFHQFAQGTVSFLKREFRGTFDVPATIACPPMTNQ
jgi:hypothetical protein